MLHVALTEDPELDATALPVPRHDTHTIDPHDIAAPEPKRRFRHWKTVEWKRRKLRRAQRNSAADPRLAPEVAEAT